VDADRRRDKDVLVNSSSWIPRNRPNSGLLPKRRFHSLKSATVLARNLPASSSFPWPAPAAPVPLWDLDTDAIAARFEAELEDCKFDEEPV
jgi:hypothetical protein